jgi:hypothetical protein
MMRLAILFALGVLLHAQKGTIEGLVKDKQTGEPLIGATVVLVGTYKGAYADAEGRFTLKDLNPGTYTLRVTYVGYNEVLLTGLTVKADQTLNLTILMSPVGTTIQTVEIIGEKPVVNLESGKSDLRVSGEEIRQTTAVDVTTMASLMPGVAQTLDGLQIRGGRVYETQYVIEGVNAQDPLAGTGFGVEVSQVAIEEMEVITGGMDAEYGDGTSGVVAVRLREGSDKWRFSGRYQKDQLGGLLRREGWNTDIFNLAIGGPLLREKETNRARLTFFASADIRLTDEYFGVQASQLYSSLLEESTSRDPLFRLVRGPSAPPPKASSSPHARTINGLLPSNSPTAWTLAPNSPSPSSRASASTRIPAPSRSSVATRLWCRASSISLPSSPTTPIRTPTAPTSLSSNSIASSPKAGQRS